MKCSCCKKEFDPDLFKKCPSCGTPAMRVDSHVPSPKKRWTALVLLIFFGTLGAHRFYAGRIKGGIFILVLSLLSAAFLVAASLQSGENGDLQFELLVYGLCWGIAAAVFLIIDFIQILTGKFKDRQDLYLK